MKAARIGRKLWTAMTMTLLLALSVVPACAQCAMCRAAFNGGSGASLGQSLNRGIIILLIPPVAIFCAIFITAIKYGKAADVRSKKIF
jgi:hypothetical protein